MRKHRYLRRIEFVTSATQAGRFEFGNFRALFELTVERLRETDELPTDLLKRAALLSGEVSREAMFDPGSEPNRARLLQEVTAWLGEASF